MTVKRAHLRFNMHNRPEPSRKKGSAGNYSAIYRPYVKALLDANSYKRRVLTVVAAGSGTSQEITDRFNDRYGALYKRKKTQGGIVNYLTQLQTYGLVIKTELPGNNVVWSLTGGVDTTNGEALVAIAAKRLSELKGDNQPKVSRLPMHGDLMKRISEANKIE